MEQNKNFEVIIDKLIKAIEQYNARDRRFGGVKEDGK